MSDVIRFDNRRNLQTLKNRKHIIHSLITSLDQAKTDAFITTATRV